MTFLQIVVLAIVQGVTEFLPISSSGHLILVPAVTGWSDQGVVVDIAVHLGSLAAVVCYFRGDVQLIWRGIVDMVAGRRNEATRLASHLALATFPIVIAGGALYVLAGNSLRDVAVIAWATLLFGLLLWIVDRMGATSGRMSAMRLPHVVLIGFAQVLALIPGTSRSGITMTAARALGYERTEAARFSILLSIPTILAAGGVLAYDLQQAPSAAALTTAALAAILAFVAALAAIAAMMRWLRSSTFTPFVVYRVILGLLLLVWVYGG